MPTLTRANWLALCVVAFCALVWAGGVYSISRTAHLYANRSPHGFRHDVVYKARTRWVEFKRIVAPPPVKNSGKS